MISPASLLHTPLTTPPSKHFCSWLSCSTEACFRVFLGKNEQTMNRRGHTAQHTLPFLPSTGHCCSVALDMHMCIPVKDAPGRGWGKQGISCLPVRDKDVCRSCTPVLSLSLCLWVHSRALLGSKKYGAHPMAGRIRAEEESHHNLRGLQLG